MVKLGCDVIVHEVVVGDITMEVVIVGVLVFYTNGVGRTCDFLFLILE